MTTKSDNRDATRISATEASRSFSRLLDEVQAGRRYIIHRRGRDVCLLAPPSVRRRASECLELLHECSPVLLDDAFEADLLEILSEEPLEERPPWGS